MQKIELEAKIMRNLSVIFYFLRRISCLIVSKYNKTRVLGKNKVDTYGAPVFAPDYSATVLATKICTNSLCLLYFYVFSHEQWNCVKQTPMERNQLKIVRQMASQVPVKSQHVLLNRKNDLVKQTQQLKPRFGTAIQCQFYCQNTNL